MQYPLKEKKIKRNSQISSKEDSRNQVHAHNNLKLHLCQITEISISTIIQKILNHSAFTNFPPQKMKVKLVHVYEYKHQNHVLANFRNFRHHHLLNLCTKCSCARGLYIWDHVWSNISRGGGGTQFFFGGYVPHGFSKVGSTEQIFS